MSARCGCDFDSCGNLRHMCDSCSAIQWSGRQAARLANLLERAEPSNVTALRARAEKAEAQADALAQTIRDVLLILGETRGDSGAPVSVNMLHRALASYDSGRQMPEGNRHG